MSSSTSSPNKSSSSILNFIIFVLSVTLISMILYQKSSVITSREVSSKMGIVASLETAKKDLTSSSSSSSSEKGKEKEEKILTNSNGLDHRPIKRKNQHEEDEKSLMTATGKQTIQQRYEYMTKKIFVPQRESKLASSSSSAKYFAGLTYHVVSQQKNQNNNNEIYRNPKTGYAEVNWTITMNCLNKVHKIYFSSTDDFSKLIPFTEKNLPQSNHNNNNQHLHVNTLFQHYIRNNWDVIHDISGKSNDFGLRMRAFGFCLKGGGAGVQKMMTESDWQKRGGSGKQSHPYMMALHGGVSPLRALVQGFRSAEYLGVPISRVFLFGRNDVMNFLPTRTTLSSNSMFSPLILSTENKNNNNNDASLLLFKKHQNFIVKSFPELTQENRKPTSKRLQDSTSDRKEEEEPFVIVDLGGGHNSLLNAMCPPNSHIWCYGVDFAPKLIEQGSYFFPHLDLRPGVSAPHIPTGTVDALLSNAVMPMIKYLQNCGHLREIIRLLRPGRGIAQIWQPALYLFNRFHPSFFVEDEENFLQQSSFESNSANRKFSFIPDWDDNRIEIDPTSTTSNEKQNNKNHQQQQQKIDASKIMSRCPGNFGRFISRIDVIADDPRLPIYTPRWTRANVKKCTSCQGGTFGIRIFRNEKSFGDDFDETPKNFEPEDEDNKNQNQNRNDTTVAKSLKPPRGLVDCYKSEQNWRNCAHLDSFTIRKVFECQDQLKKWMDPGSRMKVKGWCPEQHQDLLNEVNKFRSQQAP